MTQQADEVREVLRAVWAAQGEDAADARRGLRPHEVVQEHGSVSFDGLAEPGSDLSGAWRERLAREGKLNTSGGTHPRPGPRAARVTLTAATAPDRSAGRR